jgi:hypothetical protein
MTSISFRCAGTAACLGGLIMTLRVTPVAAAPAMDVFAPRVLAAAPADSGKYRARMWSPRERIGAIHLHGGVFALNKAAVTSPTIGARIGIHMGVPLLFGVMTDWTYQSKSLLQPSNNGLPGPQPNIVLAKVEGHLVPAMAFVQVTLTDKFFLAPYAGVAGGYEWLILRGNDYRNGASASATYGNLAWQSFGGVGLRLSPALRVDGEAFYNGGSLGRDVTDASGVSWRETVNVNGAGARLGLHIVY